MNLLSLLRGMVFLATLGGMMIYGAETALVEIDGKTFASPTEGLKHGRYWIGLRCTQIPESVRVQLNLDADEGLMVAHVLEGSPAQSAGIRRYDVLLKADGTVLRGIEQLVHAVQDSADGTLRLELMRQGGVDAVEVTPAVRQPFPFADSTPRRPEMDRALDWLERNRMMDESGRRYRVFQPGVWIDSFQQIEFPENTSIHIERVGDGPMGIRVKRNEDSWEVSSDSLDQLPDDVRAYVERLQATTSQQFAPYLRMVESFLNKREPSASPHDLDSEFESFNAVDRSAKSSSLEERLQQILDRVERIEKRIEK